GPTITLYPGDTVQMNPTGNCLYYQWSPPQGLSATNVSNPLAYPLVNTRYYATGTTEFGCETMDSVDVIVTMETMLAMPNAFAPGNGEKIKLVKRGEAELKSLRIYDRWGVLVFESKNIDEGWDGRYKGTTQPMGVYVYQVDAVGPGPNGTKRTFRKNGNISLIR
ncbi:MAG TPA: gliding motility-associated C-terminal domain-containing protein, partial [Flavipsychrobacter sp.]|nr:gliding motility-associated C-terminal domain-containing protein [Flavipsychrobacter sp.]